MLHHVAENLTYLDVSREYSASIFEDG